MSMQVHQIDFHRLDMQTRFPFRYGIASMCEVPHLFVRMHVEIDNQMWQGTSSEGLPPKWFTKNPETDFKADDLPEMLTVIKQAARFAMTRDSHRDFFSWWMELSDQQTAWAAENGQPPLLANLGVSLMERAALDATCRQQRSSLSTVLFQNRLGIDLSAIRSHLTGKRPSDILPSQPRSRVQLRHTIGLGDPLTESEIPVEEKLEDNLPQSLTSSIDRYGLRYFKIKLSGRLDADLPRMRSLSKLLRERVGESMRFTLDGNEQYATMASFKNHWQELNNDASIRGMVNQSLLFVEQPVHRDTALRPEVKDTLEDWREAPPVIIDESDAEIDSLPTALDLGYVGTSHKNCKGIIKSIAALGTIQREQPGNRKLILSAEDLGNIGPVALLQDLAVVASLGISHVERNGHHYFAGLSMFPAPIQNQTAQDHPDLYQRNASDLLALQPRNGQLQLGSVNAAPMGISQHIDLQHFPRWDF